MSIPGPIKPYDLCGAEEKIHRLKVLYTWGTINIIEFERRVAEALAEEDVHRA